MYCSLFCMGLGFPFASKRATALAHTAGEEDVGA